MLNRLGLVFPAIVKLAVCVDSLDGPATMPVAQPGTDCAPADRDEDRLGCTLNDGASFTPVRPMMKVLLAEVSTPPPTVPPLSLATTVIVARPKALAAG